MSVAPKLLKCRVNMTYFVKNYEILIGDFEENEEQIPWKHNIYCTCEACISYFSEEQTDNYTIKNCLLNTKG